MNNFLLLSVGIYNLPLRIFSPCLEFSPGATNYVDTSLNERSLVSGWLYLYLELLYSTLIYNFSFSRSFGLEGEAGESIYKLALLSFS